jgi:hypothetical protein
LAAGSWFGESSQFSPAVSACNWELARLFNNLSDRLGHLGLYAIF